MMTANLVGFVVGIDGVKFLASQLSGTWGGVQFMALATTCLFMGVKLMFEYRYVFFSSFRYLLHDPLITIGRKNCGKAFKGGVNKTVVYSII